MKIWELDKTEGKKYKIVNDDNLSKDIEPLTWSFSSDGSFVSSEGGDIAIYFNIGRTLNFEFEELRKSKELTGYERVRDGKTFYFISDTGLIAASQDDNFTDRNNELYEIGNYFSARDAAKKESKIIGLYQKLKRFSVENGWKDEMLCDSNIPKFYFNYDVEEKKFEVDSLNYYIGDSVYFTSKIIAEKAIELFGNEFKEVYGLK